MMPKNPLLSCHEEYKTLLARNSLYGFILATMPSYQAGWVHEEICRELDEFLQAVVEGKRPRLMLTLPPRHGKLCADETPVLTPQGWTTHGELRPGDFVFHPSGNPVKVMAVGEKDYATHRVSFANGDQIDVHLDHEWRIYDRAIKEYRTVETRFFVEHSQKLDRGEEAKGERYPYQVDRARFSARKAERIGIVSVEELQEPKPGNCIQVDSEDGLYLVGKHFTTTHNSEIASRRFPAYVLGRYPKMSIIATSYSADLSTRMSRDVQRIMMSDEYAALFPDVAFSQKRDGAQRRADYFENGLGGSYRSAGVGGGITGMGGDIILIDDPFKDRASADSATIRQTVWDWYTSTLYTRLSPNGGIIVINTRWHMDDLSGRLLEAETRGEGDKWRVVNFPAIAEADEKHRKQGEALHPDRYPLDQLESIKKAVGTRDWEALYQQHPVPDGGAIFKQEWFRTYTRPPDKMDAFVMSWDMTFKEGAQSDFVVGQVWGRKGADFYLIDQVRGQWGFTETLAQFRLLSKKYPEARRKLVEDKANGPAVIETLKHEIPGIVPVEPDGSKTARAYAVTAIFEAGNVYIPDSSIMPWIKEFTTEMLQFPSGAHDDVVDSCVQAIRFFDRSKGLSLSSKLTKRLNARF